MIVGGIIKVKDNGSAVSQKGDGENVAKAGVRDVGHQKVNLCFGVGFPYPFAIASPHLYSGARGRPDGLDLDPPERALPDENEIEGVAVSPGLGDGKALGDGFVHDDEFGDIAALFAMKLPGPISGRRRFRQRLLRSQDWPQKGKAPEMDPALLKTS